jgi:ATP-dependent DNA helicase RecQ
MQDQAQVIVATNAFGMGIDKATVKTQWFTFSFLIIENYYQEAGEQVETMKKHFNFCTARPIAYKPKSVLNISW